MNTTIKNIIALIIGLIIGNIVNMAIIMIGPSLIPLPAGIDLTNYESLVANISRLEAQHYIMPFLAHALGTLVAGYIAVKLAHNRKLMIAKIVGFFFLIGGLINAFILPAPLWFEIFDVAIAYIPMSILGYTLARKQSLD